MRFLQAHGVFSQRGADQAGRAHAAHPGRDAWLRHPHAPREDQRL